jgi:hypothetical protein
MGNGCMKEYVESINWGLNYMMGIWLRYLLGWDFAKGMEWYKMNGMWNGRAVNGVDWIVVKRRNTCVMIYGKEGNGIDYVGQCGEVRVRLSWWWDWITITCKLCQSGLQMYTVATEQFRIKCCWYVAVWQGGNFDIHGRCDTSQFSL